MNMRRLLVAVTLSIMICIPIAGAAVVTTLPDPVGDTFGVGPVQHDITSLMVTLTDPPSPRLIFDLALVDPISPPSAVAADSLVGYLAIDTDQNATLSDLLSVDFTDPASLAAAGIDYYVDLFSELSNPGNVDLVRASDLSAVATVPIAFAAKNLSLEFLVSDLGGDDGLANYAGIVGTFSEPTDQVLPAQAAVPEPASLSVWGLLLAVLAFRRRRLATAPGAP